MCILNESIGTRPWAKDLNFNFIKMGSQIQCEIAQFSLSHFLTIHISCCMRLGSCQLFPEILGYALHFRRKSREDRTRSDLRGACMSPSHVLLRKRERPLVHELLVLCSKPPPPKKKKSTQSLVFNMPLRSNFHL
uniref:Uncharacterized protein n=1 Tax=Opuntia streptacantha TaxID=393608 RepID=A0A7C9AZB2_OPUST